MLSATVYLINGFVLSFFFWKTYSSLKKKYNPFFVYFLGSVFFYSIAFFVYALVITFSVLTDNHNILYWLDIVGLVLIFIGSAFAVQIPLYKYLPKNKKRFVMSAVIGLIGMIVIFYKLMNPTTPEILGTGMVDWDTSFTDTVGMSLILLLAWIPASIVFYVEFVRSGFKSQKTFFLATGFLVSVLSVVFQDYVTGAWLLVVNLFYPIGFILILVGLIYREE